MAVTNLTGYTWVGNETLSSVGSPFAWHSSSTDQLSLNFTSNGNNYTAFGNWHISQPIKRQFIGYDSTNAYDYVTGWMDEAYKTILFTGGSDITNTTLIMWLEANGTLTPPTPAGYEVTFVTNGGTSVTDLTEQTTLPNPLPTTTKANHVFAGWFYDSGFEEQAFSGDTVSSNITLYAKWYANMEDFYEDVANEIRIKNGETNPIKHTDFAYKIKNIQGAKELTQAQYDALPVYDDDTYYLIVEDE